ncbi:MAG: hypothetical protein KA715_02615 [Xanthomonadaceae bacterium]|nr:hypothetical protein [Xanthomonadaceae bacterium]
MTIKTALWVVAVVLKIGVGHASQELDRQFLLDKIGTVRSIDNSDGIFAESVAEAFNEYFSKQSRFKYQDVSKADALLGSSKLAYEKLIDDARILAQIGKAFQINSLIKTKIYKEGTSYRVEWQWVRLPQAQILASYEFSVSEAESSASILTDVLKSEIKRQLPKLFAKMPFKGHITGRDGETVTVNVGKENGVFKGDMLIVQTLEDVKIHPLSKAVVDWQFVKIGRLKVVESDENIAFCKVMDLEEEKEITRLQKITAFIPHEEEPEEEAKKPVEEFERPYIPKLGYIAGTLSAGSFSRNFSDSSVGGVGKTGGGMSLGLLGEGELWLNRNFFVDIATGFNTLGYTQKDITTNVETAGVSGSYFRFRGNLGYQIHLTPDFFGPKVFIKMGYMSNSYALPASVADVMAGASFGSVFLGVGTDLPLRPHYGMLASLNMGLLKSVSAADQVGTASGTALSAVSGITDVSFFLGGYYWFHSRLKLRVGIDVISHGATFGTTHTLNHRLVYVSPKLIYYF